MPNVAVTPLSRLFCFELPAQPRSGEQALLGRRQRRKETELEINVFDPTSDITSITGFTIVVDVFRAFSVSYYISANNPKKYLVLDDIEKAFLLKKLFQNTILIETGNESYRFKHSSTQNKQEEKQTRKLKIET